MAEDLATLAVTLDNTQAIAAAKATGVALDDMGSKGTAAARNIQASANPIEQAIKKQEVAYRQVTDASRAMTLAQIQAIKMNEEMIAGNVEHSFSLGRVAKSFESATVRAVGLNEQLGLMTAAFGHMEFGELAVVGALTGILAGVLVWKAWTEETSKAKAEQDRLTESLEKWYQTERQGIAGQFPQQIEAETAKVKELSRALDDMMGGKFFSSIASVGEGGSRPFAWIRVLTSALTGDFSQLSLEIGKGFANTAREITDGAAAVRAAANAAFDARVSGIAKLISGGSASTRERADAVRLLAADRASLGRLSVGAHADDDDVLKERVHLLEEIKTLSDALKPPTADTTYAKATIAIHDQAAAVEAETAALKSGESTRVTHAADLLYEQQLAAARLEQDPKLLADRIREIEALHNANVAQADYNQSVEDAKKAREELARASEEAWKRDGEAIKKAIDEADRAEKHSVDSMTRSLAQFFDDVMVKGHSAFSQLFDDIERMFEKMLAEMTAKNIMQALTSGGSNGGSGGSGLLSSLSGVLGLVGSGSGSSGSMLGLSSGGILGASISSALPFLGAGGIAGYLTGGLGRQSGGQGALSGAAAGAGAGALLGSVVPVVGTLVGGIIGGAAGLVSGFLGAKHGAEAAAAALLQIQQNETQVASTLASWRAQITGTAADQKAAALLNIKLQYMQMQAQIEQLEAGKKMEAQRNKDLADAADLYAMALKKSASSVTGAFTSLVNAVEGYKYQATIFQGAGASGGIGSPGTTPIGGDLHMTLVLDGSTLGKGVIKDFARRKARGDKTLTAVLAT